MKWNSVLEVVERFFLWLACFTLLLMMLLTFSDALLRYLFNNPLPGAYEIVQEYLIPYFVYLTIGFVFARGGHVRVTMLTEHLPDKVNQVLLVLFNVLTLILFVLIGFGSMQRTINSFILGEYSASILAYPIAPAYFSVVLGSFLLSIRLVESIVKRQYPDALQLNQY